jgi:hypothetical protein
MNYSEYLEICFKIHTLKISKVVENFRRSGRIHARLFWSNSDRKLAKTRNTLQWYLVWW